MMYLMCLMHSIINMYDGIRLLYVMHDVLDVFDAFYYKYLISMYYYM